MTDKRIGPFLVEATNTLGIPTDDPYAPQSDLQIWTDYRQIRAKYQIPVQPVQIRKWDSVFADFSETQG